MDMQTQWTGGHNVKADTMDRRTPLMDRKTQLMDRRTHWTVGHN